MKHGFRRALAAVAVLAPTLVGGVGVGPAYAGVNYTKLGSWGDHSIGFAKALSYNAAQNWYGTEAIVYPKPPGLTNCTDGDNLAIQAWNLDDIPYLDSHPNLGMMPTRWLPGATQIFCIAIEDEWDSWGGAWADTWQTAYLSIVSAGAELGRYTMSNTGGNHGQISPNISVRMDTAPLNGSNDGLLGIGDYKLVVGFTTASSTCSPTACDSEGNSPAATNGEYGPGILNVFGYLWGAHPNLNNASELTQEQTALGKDFSFVRDFRPDWGSPAARVATWNNEDKIVAWSVKPPNWSGTCGAWTPTPLPNGTCPNNGTSPWAVAAADTAAMRSMVQSLQNSATTGGVPFNTISISHEPHDNAIDDKGWNFGSGGSGVKCGSTTDPSADPAGDIKPCLGTRSQYIALYSALRQVRDTACNSSGGTTGTLGYKCPKVLIQYIAVPVNMVNKVSGGITGSADYMRPNYIDYDILGGDPYNYSCFGKPQPPAGGACTSSDWSSFQKTVDDPNAATDANGERVTLLGLARNQGKPVLIDEVGSHPGCNGSQTTNGCNSSTTFSRATWFNDMYAYLNPDARAQRYILGFAYFHELKSNDWRFIDTTAGGNVDDRGFTEYKANFASNANYLSDSNTSGVVFHPYA